ncbi:zinc finger protein ZAT12-like [Rhododendron vialii]|uniref:zinc finger protein ZAT12-like n=1 Tax=Rhododendron vialii TaxID=182163 RepID=UPI00265FA183|nr:zinc finger protein ZAT12-like [Rhododendron vialii]
MANSLMLLSRVGAAASSVFACKMCNQKFSTTGGDFLHVQAPEKPKTHECSICGLEFAIGQALGHCPTTYGKAEDRPNLEHSVGSEKRERLLDLSLTLAQMFSVLNLG